MENNIEEKVETEEIRNEDTVESSEQETQVEPNPIDEKGNLADLLRADKEYEVMNNLIQLKSTIKTISGSKDAMKDKLKTQTTDPNIAIVESRLEAIDLETLKKLDLKNPKDVELIESIITIEGQVLEVTIPVEESKKNEFFKDFLIYLKATAEETAKFEAAEAKFQIEYDKLMEECKELIGEEKIDELDGMHLADFHRNHLRGLLDKESVNEEIKTQIRTIMSAQDAGATISYLKDNIKKQIDAKKNSRSIVQGYRNNFMDIVTQCDKILKTKFTRYNININTPAFCNLEDRFFPEFKEYNDLFMFLLFRHIKHNYEKITKLEMLSFVETLLCVQWLNKPVEERPERIKVLEESIKEILTMVIESSKVQ